MILNFRDIAHSKDQSAGTENFYCLDLAPELADGRCCHTNKYTLIYYATKEQRVERT